MPQLDFNTFAGVAWWVTIIFYFSYIWVLIFPFARFIAREKSALKYRLWIFLKLIKLFDEKQNDKK